MTDRDLEEEVSPVSDEETVSDEEVRDELPADLDITALETPYEFPNNSRRRVPGLLYLLMGAIAVLAWFLTEGDNPVLVNSGWLLGGIGLAVFGLYHLQGGWSLDFDERDALVAATQTVGFPIGHASAQLGWRGLRSRPTWRILLYSNESPPKKRGLVLVDGVDGEVIDEFVEDNPEDWTGLE